MSFKALFFGILIIIAVGIGGLVYRNAIEHSSKQIACPLDAKVCPDGTTVGRTGLSCTFPTCPPPNVSLDSAGISYAIPAGFSATALPDAASVAAYESAGSASTSASAQIIIRQYPITASSTALDVIQATAIGDASGVPVPATSYSSTNIGQNHFTVVKIGRFEGTVDTAYYLAHGQNVLRFDAVDQNVLNWTDPSLDVSSLPAEKGLQYLLSTL